MLSSLLTILLLLAACDDKPNQNNHNNPSHTDEQPNESQPTESENEPDPSVTEDNKSNSDVTANQNANEADSKVNNTNHPSDNTDDNKLSNYMTQEIEYARVWLELGDRQAIDTLYAERIPAGEPLHPDDKTSLDYPENVVQLSGEQLIDGVVTYSSNGDGTVNVYNVPKRWDGKNPAGEAFYQDIIDETIQHPIPTGEDEQVEELIQKIEIID